MNLSFDCKCKVSVSMSITQSRRQLLSICIAFTFFFFSFHFLCLFLITIYFFVCDVVYQRNSPLPQSQKKIKIYKTPFPSTKGRLKCKAPKCIIFKNDSLCYHEALQAQFIHFAVKNLTVFLRKPTKNHFLIYHSVKHTKKDLTLYTVLAFVVSLFSFISYHWSHSIPPEKIRKPKVIGEIERDQGHETGSNYFY